MPSPSPLEMLHKLYVKTVKDLEMHCRRKEILKIRAKINAKETKETIAKIKAKSWFFERIGEGNGNPL